MGNIETIELMLFDSQGLEIIQDPNRKAVGHRVPLLCGIYLCTGQSQVSLDDPRHPYVK